MPTRLAILGLDLIQRDWLHAVAALCDAGEVDVVAVGHRSPAATREAVEFFKPTGGGGGGGGGGGIAAPGGIPVFDDLRLLVKETTPQVLLMDRPPNASLEFLRWCAVQGIAILSLGPPVESLAEAQALAQVLEPRTHLLHIWPRFADSPVSHRCAAADDFLRPIRFASASWLGVNYALAKTAPPLGDCRQSDVPVRSLSVLAWDLLGTLIPLMGLPTSVYAAIRGTVSGGNSFADISGAASVTLRFPEDAAASLTICDRVPTIGHLGSSGPGTSGNRRDLMLWGNGTLHVTADAYEFRDEVGKLIDASVPPPLAPAPLAAESGNVNDPLPEAIDDADTITDVQPSLFSATARPPVAAPPPSSPPRVPSVTNTLREFLHHYALPPSPHRGWPHHLEEIAATLEAMVVSHRTGQPESPERLQRLRR